MNDVIDLENPDRWPSELLSYLDQHYQLFLQWETRPAGFGNTQPLAVIKASVAEYERAMAGLDRVLHPYELIGYHCTRLTVAEIEEIKANGMHLPSLEKLNGRIDRLERSGTIPSSIARRLRKENQADEENRRHMIWFTFFEPHIAGESGIGCLVGLWGGEALYNSHEEDPETGPILEQIGAPCVIEATVPISSLNPHSYLGTKLVRRFLKSRGLITRECVDHEDYAIEPLMAASICQIHTFPSTDFVRLTGCGDWHESLALAPQKN